MPDVERLLVMERDIAVLKSITEDQERRLQANETNNNTLAKMSVILEQNAEFNRKVEKQFEKQADTMQQINTSLTTSTLAIQEINGKLGKVENRVDGLEKENAEDREKASEKTENKLAKVVDNIWKVAMTAVTAWVLLKLGLS